MTNFIVYLIGTLLVVAHDSSNLAEGTGGPQDARVLMTAADVLADLDGLSFDGRAKNPAKLAISAMPIGTRFGWADLPGTHQVKASAVLQARQLGMIRRITFRRLFSTWEVMK